MNSELTCLDGMVIYGFSGSTKLYNKNKALLDNFLNEEIIKEWGSDIQDAIDARLIKAEDVIAYYEK
jgi:hypothetical protein